MDKQAVLLFYQLSASFSTLLLWVICDQLKALYQKPRRPEECASICVRLDQLWTFAFTPAAVLTVYFGIWSLDADHQRLRSLWSLVTLVLTVALFFIENRARHDLTEARGGIGGSAGEKRLASAAGLLVTITFMLIILYWQSV